MEKVCFVQKSTIPQTRSKFAWRFGLYAFFFFFLFFKKDGPFPASFLYFRLFYKQLTVNICSLKVADYWIWTRVLWYWKQPLCQQRHNHCPIQFFCIMCHLKRNLHYDNPKCTNFYDPYSPLIQTLYNTIPQVKLKDGLELFGCLLI